jgi:hypothetical protein
MVLLDDVCVYDETARAELASWVQLVLFRFRMDSIAFEKLRFEYLYVVYRGHVMKRC